MLIDIEGTDGSGKKTQTELLKKALEENGKKVLLLSFPNHGHKSCTLVKMYLEGELGADESLDPYQVSTLYAADRMITMHQNDIAKYDYVLFDRYTPSNMIHQSTKCKDEDIDIFLDWVADFEYNKMKLPVPDVTIFLDMPVEKSLELLSERANTKHGGKDILENEQHLRKAYARAKYVANKFNWLHISCVENGNIKSIEQIHSEVMDVLNLNNLMEK